MKKTKKVLATLTLGCFAMTMTPVASFAVTAPGVDYQQSSIFTEDVEVKTGEALDVRFDFDNALASGEKQTVYFWFVKDGMNVPSTSAAIVYPEDMTEEEKAAYAIKATELPGVYTIDVDRQGYGYKMAIQSAGTYTMRASFQNPATTPGATTTAEKITNVEQQLPYTGRAAISVTTTTSSRQYKLVLVEDAGLPFSAAEGDILADDGVFTIGAGANTSTAGTNNHLNTNGVASDKIKFKLVDDQGKAIKGETITLTSSSPHCVLNKETATTDQLGQFDFTIALDQDSPDTNGFKIYLESGSYTGILQITASSGSAYELSMSRTPSSTISTDDMMAGSDLGDYFWITTKDVNGNYVKPYAMQAGGNHAEPAFAGYTKTGETVGAKNSYDKSAEAYVSVVSKPAGSELENKNCWLVPVGQNAAYQSTLYFDEDLIAGDYTIRVTLANGKHQDISFKVAEMGTPVQMIGSPKATVTELGGQNSITYYLLDANGVSCKAAKKGTTFATTGNAVLKAGINSLDANTYSVTLKNDDKYLGSAYTVIATNERYNLTATNTLKVGSGNAQFVCMTREAKTNTPTDLLYLLMDGAEPMNLTTGLSEEHVKMMQNYGMPVTLSSGNYRMNAAQTSFTVVSKPEGAKVTFDARAAGGNNITVFTDTRAWSRIECDKPGTVVVKYSLGFELYDETTGTWSPRYYEGTHSVVFSDQAASKSVVMSIGSGTIIVAGKAVAIDAAPIIRQNRTYVPFRALAEAFGAEVAYDDATRTVTAALGGTTVTMTIDSEAYTVNGAEKVADVAPYISGGRTMVPVRFAAEAFGSKLTVTTDEKGATADILFHM